MHSTAGRDYRERLPPRACDTMQSRTRLGLRC
jgi:hypothetical protein